METDTSLENMLIRQDCSRPCTLARMLKILGAFHEMARRVPYYRDNGTRIGVVQPLDENDIVEIYRRSI